jgi:hypothetical protein
MVLVLVGLAVMGLAVVCFLWYFARIDVRVN